MRDLRLTGAITYVPELEFNLGIIKNYCCLNVKMGVLLY